MHKIWLFGYKSLITLLLLILVGCGAVSPSETSNVENDVTYPSVTDIKGEVVEIVDPSRIVTLGGPVTEIVFALGAGDRVVAIDSSSLYPPEATELPDVGYQRQLSAEGVLAQNPTLVLATDEAGPPEVITQLQDSGVTVLILPAEKSVAGAQAKIRGFAQALGLEEKGEALITDMEADLAKAQALQEQMASQPKVMFIYARGPGAVNVGGVGTSAEAMIHLAGGTNVVTEYENYKPLTAEAIVAAAPELILMMSLGLESVGGVEGLLEQPGLLQTPAGQNKKIVAMDDLYLLGFGPRLGQATLDLTYELHPELERE